MGDREVIADVDRAGGLANWIPPDPASIRDEWQRKQYELCSWYREYARRPESMPTLFLGWGKDDNLSVPNGFVASTLPANQRATRPGGHAWTIWQPLFDELAARALAPAAAGDFR